MALSKYRILLASVEAREKEEFFIYPAGQVTKKTCGVYTIWFGEKYYIGSSENVVERVRQHRKMINGAFRSRNFSMPGSYKPLLVHLWCNLEVRYGVVKMIVRCSESNLCKLEKKYLLKYGQSENCLNISLTATSRRAKKEKNENPRQRG